MTLKNTHSDDAVNIAPDLHTVIYEDDRLRVLKVVVPSGAVAQMHWHPHNINYVLAGGTLQFTKPDSGVVSVEVMPGQVTASTNSSSHAVENIGATTVETIQVELKD